MPLCALIVEDDKNFRRLVEIRLRGWCEDIEITLADSLGAARRILDEEEKDFSLVILDQHLPDGMGWTLFSHPKLTDAAVLAVSADDAPELPGKTVQAGAKHFLRKQQIAEPLLLPLLDAILERKKLEAELIKSKIEKSRMDTIRVLLGTLRHEINNPLGAVLGGAFLLRAEGELDDEQQKLLGLIEESGKRIKHVLEQLCEAAELQEITKGSEQLFHVPGDPEWDKSKK
jgi:signal transduction histidine kinase